MKSGMQISNDYVLREILNECIIVPTGSEAMRFQGVIAVNETGAFLWKYLQTHDAEEEELAKALCKEYDVEKSQALQDVGEFLELLRKNGIIDPVE